MFHNEKKKEKKPLESFYLREDIIVYRKSGPIKARLLKELQVGYEYAINGLEWHR